MVDLGPCPNCDITTVQLPSTSLDSFLNYLGIEALTFELQPILEDFVGNGAAIVVPQYVRICTALCSRPLFPDFRVGPCDRERFSLT